MTKQPLQPSLPMLGDKRLNQRWGGLQGCSVALAIAEAAYAWKKPCLVIAKDSLSCQQIAHELRFFLSGLPEPPCIQVFADWETLPYDHFSAHQDLISERLATLATMQQQSQGITLVAASTLMQRIAPIEYVNSNSFVLRQGDRVELEGLRARFIQAGYHAVQQVFAHGEFSVRGALFDVFPMGSKLPYRIELFDDEVESIRTFDPENQRSLSEQPAIKLLPAREYPLDDDGIALFRQQWREQFNGNPLGCPLYESVSQGASAGGIEYYLPLFFKQTASLCDYLMPESIVFRLEGCEQAAEQFWLEVNERFEQCNIDRTRPCLAPPQLFFRWDALGQTLNQYHQVRLGQRTEKAHIKYETQAAPELFINHKLTNPLQALSDHRQHHPTQTLVICAESKGRRESLLTLLQKHHLQPKIVSDWQAITPESAELYLCIAAIDKGCELKSLNRLVLSEQQLFGQKVMQRRRRQLSKHRDNDQLIRNLAELSVGSPVVHLDHGIGRYLGLETIESNGIRNEFLCLAYAENSKLYVPITSLHLISRYSGAELSQAPLHRLGSNKWDQNKQKAIKQLRDVAAELLATTAKRAQQPGISHALNEEDYDAFASGFPFEETADQAQAIQQVLADMQSNQKMDRLICGDVGFGKTEVAMRAAFVAVQNQKQVALLVPTTLLAQQHFDTFSDRFADWPVRVEVISRFRTSKQQQTIIDQLAEGKIDIIIGTHKLLQSNINFDSLGLLIIDEEHRFGVRQKERIKQLRCQVDLLTLTATPIPRTLNLSLSGLRDLSLITTPPAKRLSVKTFIHEYSDSLIREALLREILRGGQVYFLHNQVDTIERVARELQQLVPEARIQVGHGQMRERELEAIMSDFYHQRFNVLVCTTIIETGIDIPTANTMVIHRADKFGLAQLHQLRGRVGRSHHQAYAYLLTPDAKLLSSDAKKRLQAIAALEDLGAGFMLATHDLEIRGAGELLGEEQSGNLQAMGLTLYTELLDKTIKALQAGESLDIAIEPDHGCEIDLHLTNILPDDYVHDVHQRLILYKRIANAHSQETLDELQVELIDRFGLLPLPAKNLLNIAHLRLLANQLGVRKLEATAERGRIEFAEKTNVDPLKIIELIQKQPQSFKLAGSQTLQFFTPNTPADKRIERVTEVLQLLK